MGYYHIELSSGEKRLCTIFLPRGNYHYQKLSIGVGNPRYISGENIQTIFRVKYSAPIHKYVVIITKKHFIDNLKALVKVLQKIVEEGLKVNPEKSFFR